MVVIEHENSLQFRAHNGRHYNIIITYDNLLHEFKISQPKLARSWNNEFPTCDKLYGFNFNDEEKYEITNFITKIKNKY